MLKNSFLYMNNEQSEKEMIKAIPFTITSARIKDLGVNQGGERLIQW